MWPWRNLKVVHNEKEGRPARWLLLVLSMGPRRSRFVLFSRRLFFNVFPFRSSTHKLSCDFHVIGRCAPEQAHLSYNAPIIMAHRFPYAISKSAQNKKKNQRNLIWNLKTLCIRSVLSNDTWSIYLSLCLHLRLTHHLYLLCISIYRLIQKGEVHRTVQSAFPYNLYLLSGNGNTLKKRQCMFKLAWNSVVITAWSGPNFGAWGLARIVFARLLTRQPSWWRVSASQILPMLQ